MALWGAVAGIATLVGPILGGLLVDSLGWEWIFFVNIPVGGRRLRPRVVGWCRSCRRTAHASTGSASRCPPSACSCSSSASRRATVRLGRPAITVRLIVGGVVVLALFVLWQAQPQGAAGAAGAVPRTATSRVANVAISTMGFAITAMGFPLMLYAQLVRGVLARPQAALLLAPMAVVAIVLAPVVGRLTDRVHPRILAGSGFACRDLVCWCWPACSDADTPLWELLVPMVAVGSAAPSSGHRSPRPRPATCRSSRPGPGRASTTPPARSARCSAPPRSPCSWTAGSRPRACPSVGDRGRRRRHAARRRPGAVQRGDGAGDAAARRRWCSAWSPCCSSSARTLARRGAAETPPRCCSFDHLRRRGRSPAARRPRRPSQVTRLPAS